MRRGSDLGRWPLEASAPQPGATRQMLMTVWCPRTGEFRARVLLGDGSLHDFDSPFELLRFLTRAPPPGPDPGLR